jgi:hypothetical protein
MDEKAQGKFPSRARLVVSGFFKAESAENFLTRVRLNLKNPSPAIFFALE